MLRWWITLVLTVAGATAWAQPARPQATSQAQAASADLERRVVQLEAQRRQLTTQYAAETAAIDRLKKQRTSWRQQRELQGKLAAANDTAKQLTVVTAEHAKAVSALAASRRALVKAIDAELATAPALARKTELERLRGTLVPQVPKRVARIVLPDLEVDPLADPEELDEQAAALRESEQQLQKQIAGLDKQAVELDEVAKLRKQHERAGELSRRDDDQPQRTAREGGNNRTAAEVADGAPAPTSGGDSGSPPPAGGGGTGGGANLGGGSGFEAEATIVLSEVVDASTLETLTRASRTGDPAQRALAAKKARDAVKRRLEQLQKKRAEIEQLAKTRRK